MPDVSGSVPHHRRIFSWKSLRTVGLHAASLPISTGYRCSAFLQLVNSSRFEAPCTSAM